MNNERQERASGKKRGKAIGRFELTNDRGNSMRAGDPHNGSREVCIIRGSVS